MLTELCLSLVLHDWKPWLGETTQRAAYTVKVTVNIFQGVGMVEQTAKMFHNRTASLMQDNETFEGNPLKTEKVAALVKQHHFNNGWK